MPRSPDFFRQLNEQLLEQLEEYARQPGRQGEEVVEWVKANVHPLDIVFRLAEDHGIVLLNGGGFDAPDWSVRVSFANLDDDVYENIGRAVRAVARSYVLAYSASRGVPPPPPVTRAGAAFRS